MRTKNMRSRRQKKSNEATEVIFQAGADIGVQRLPEAPEGFPFAVLNGAQVMGWIREEDDARRLALSIGLVSQLRVELEKTFLDLAFWKLRDLRERRIV